MTKSAKRGFTLVELLVTIILLGVIGSIIIYNIMNISTNSKETEYERFITKIKSAAATYADVNPETFKDLFVNKAYLYIQIGDLIENGFLDEDLVNPYTEEKVGRTELIKANLNTDNGALMFTYPVSPDEKEEQFLLALSDYVVYREPYDCMQGAGTYQLALSDENGDLILLTPEKIQQYSFTCEYPKEFLEYNDIRDGVNYPATWKKGKYVEKAGTYDITYSWISESGTKKKAKRTLRVLPKARPAFATIEMYKSYPDNEHLKQYVYSGDDNNVIAYQFGTLDNVSATEYYLPSLVNASNNTWKILRFRPYIEGVDPETTTYSVSATALQQNLDRAVGITGTNVTYVENGDDYNFMFDVNDGIYRYDINCLVKGRYNKDYSYTAENTVVAASKLVIPEQYVVPNETGWTLEKIVSVLNKIHSPSRIVEKDNKYDNAIQYYELSLNRRSNTDLNINNANTFDHARQVNAIVYNDIVRGTAYKKVDIGNDACVDKRFEFPTVYVRAVNKNGFVGDWTSADIKLTSDFAKIVDTDNDCIKDGDNCYFKDKKIRLLFDNPKKTKTFKYIVLELKKNARNISKSKMLVTKDGVGHNATPIRVHNNEAVEADCCDMHLSGSVSYRTALVDRVVSAAKQEWKDMQNAGIPLDTMTRHLSLTKWTITARKITKKTSEGKFGTVTSFDYSDSSYSTTSFFGNVSNKELKRYEKALSVKCGTADDENKVIPGTDKCAYWTTDNYVESRSTLLQEENGVHSQRVYYYTADLYVVLGGQHTVYGNGNLVTHAYGAETHPVKPLGMMQNLEVCKYSVDAAGVKNYTIAVGV